MNGPAFRTYEHYFNPLLKDKDDFGRDLVLQLAANGYPPVRTDLIIRNWQGKPLMACPRNWDIGFTQVL